MEKSALVDLESLESGEVERATAGAVIGIALKRAQW